MSSREEGPPSRQNRASTRGRGEALSTSGGEAPSDLEGREEVGIFPSWRWVYGAVVLYGLLMIGILIALSATLSFGVGS